MSDELPGGGAGLSGGSIGAADDPAGGSEQILSQSEINALLAAVSEGKVEGTGGDEAGSPSEASSVKTFGSSSPAPQVMDYDLTSQDRVVRGRMPTLDIIDDRFCRLARVSLAGLLRKVVHVTVESTNLMKFGEFLNYLPMPSCLNIVKLSPLRGASLIAIQSKLVFQLIDTLFGGSQSEIPMKDEGRDLTTIESGVVQRVVGLLLNDLAESWKPIARLDPEFVRTETNPQFVAVVSPQDAVVQTTYEVEIESVKGTLHIIIPYASVEPLKGRLSSGVMGEAREIDATWITRLTEQLMSTHVRVRAQLGTTQLDLRDLMELGPGDVISLSEKATEPVNVEVEGSLRYRARPVVSGGHLGVEVLERMPQMLDLPGEDPAKALAKKAGQRKLTAGGD